MTHRIDVEASAEAVYRIVSDVELWPLYFPPTIRAERVERFGSEERIQLWAMANGELRTWQSKRWLYPQQYHITFEQALPSAPVALMGGAWWIDQNDDGTCSVRLDHYYRAVDDDPAVLEFIARAIDANSRSELEHLKRAAERALREPEFSVDFSDVETIRGSMEEAYDYIYDVARWPERVPHVARLEVTENEPGLQYMSMDTRSPDGSVHTTVSGRVCDPKGLIVYKQTVLPDAFLAHTGEWRFEENEPGVITVTGRHRVILDPDGLAKLPRPPASPEAARQAVRHALGTNSRTTMARAKEFVEARK
ncbi:aromatase/cyclase [Actinocorallia populi]|uniref:aromatase/cyclase n=1 Tax=Actinocorallia populi TaxID=2079200 RepID=UPI001300431A|nr:aromatase/cyclase [Actinocorallia populi]